MTRPVILILGAGPNQLSAIKKARALDADVAVTDYIPGNVGHAYADRSFEISTTDQHAVLTLARELDISGIATFASDVATPTVSYVAEVMGLRGCPAPVTQRMVFKDRFREFQRKSGLAGPAYVQAGGFDELWTQREGLSEPLVFKPVDTSGSRGVSRVDSQKKEAWRDAFGEALRYSRCGRVCIEEFVQGREIGGDAFLIEGRIVFIELTDKHKSGFVVTGHTVPLDWPTELSKLVKDEIDRTCSAIGYTDGPLNFDVMVDVESERVTVLEMSPRNGGNGIPQGIERLYGIDLQTATLEYALGRHVGLGKAFAASSACGSLIMGAPEAGTVLSITPPDRVSDKCPEVFHFEWNVKKGDRVSAFTHGGAAVGLCLFDLSEPQEYSSVADRIASQVELVTE